MNVWRNAKTDPPPRDGSWIVAMWLEYEAVYAVRWHKPKHLTSDWRDGAEGSCEACWISPSVRQVVKSQGGSMIPDLDHLEKLSRAATPGPWCKAPIFKNKWPEKYNKVAVVRGVVLLGPYASISCGNEADYIAAVNPTTVLSLIAELRRLREERASALNVIDASRKCEISSYETLSRVETPLARWQDKE